LRRPASRALERGLLASLLVLDAGVALYVLRETRPPALAGSALGAASPANSPDLVVVLVDTLRADHLGAYGYPRPTSPRIDALAREGVVFERAFSSTNWTRPAVASLFTSTMPSRHQVVDLYRALSPSMPLLAEALSARRYQTGCFTVGVNVEPQDGYGRGVDHFFVAASRRMALRPPLMKDFVLRYFPGVRRLWTSPADARHIGDPEAITERALAWVRGGAAERPLFLYVHYLGPHSPYLPPSPYDAELGGGPPEPRLADPPTHLWAGRDALSPKDRGRMIDQYDGEIRWHDGEVGRLVDGLRASGRSRPLVLLLIADHGEGFGEHGVWGHNAGMFDEVVRIPLIAWSSQGAFGPARVAAPVSMLDVAPTLVDLAGAPLPEGFDGESLRPLLEGGGSLDRLVHIENPLAREGGVRTLDWAYLEGETGADGFRSWLYRASDAAQREDVSREHPELVERLSRVVAERRKIDESRSHGSVGIELDDERREQLRALGYAD
jgi:arylsulfatase A-like enzyme